MKKFRKVMAAVMAVATMAVSVAGLSASAYSPTVTKSFSYDNATVTGSLYRDGYAYGTTSSTKSFHVLEVSVTWGAGDPAVGSSNNVSFIATTKTSGSGTASSTHTAYKNSSSHASTTISGV